MKVLYFISIPSFYENKNFKIIFVSKCFCCNPNYFLMINNKKIIFIGYLVIHSRKFLAPLNCHFEMYRN